MTDLERFSISDAVSPRDLAEVVALFRLYAASLDVDLAYQGFETELAAMPGKYAPPSGALLLARDASGLSVGCVGLRALDDAGCCEMKRLYVAPAGRGLGLGRALVEAIVERACRLGHRELCLDTLPSMLDAQALYRRMGFEVIAAYYPSPVAGTVFMRLGLVDERR